MLEKKSRQYITKYATFDATKVNKFSELLKYFKKKKKCPQLKSLLESEQWQINSMLNEDETLQRKHLLECMAVNYCLAIDFKYLWGKQIDLLLHINFRNLKQLTFSVDSDAGYLDNVAFVPKLNAPNLVKLNLSNMEQGGFSLRPLRKSFFPKLEILDLSYYTYNFKDYSALSEAYFPHLRQFSQDNWQNSLNYSNIWKAKMQSPFIRKQLEEQLVEYEQNKATDHPIKKLKN